MSWQLWVLIALAIGLAVLVVVRLRHAQRVFDDITRPDRTAQSGQGDRSGDEVVADEIAQARARRILSPPPTPRRKHG